jgi:hypothetical protein
MRGDLRAQCLLHIAQIESDQPVGKKNRGDATRAAKTMNSRFADLEDFSQLTGGQVVGAFVFWLFRHIRLSGFRVSILAISWQFIFLPVQV